MKSFSKKIPVLVLLILVSLFIQSCGTVKNELGLGDSAGITYNDLKASESDMDSDIKAIAANKKLKELFEASNTTLVDEKTGKLTPELIARWATLQMQTLAIREVREKHKKEITAADKKAALDDAKAMFEGNEEIPTEEIWNSFPKSFRDRLVESFAEQHALLRAAPKVTDAEIKQYYEDNKEQFADACESGKTISHILVDNEKEAKAIAKKIKEGQDFAKLAEKESTDTSSAKNGGSLGCYTPGNFVESFETAAAGLQPGQVSDIVKSEYGYHILKAETYDPFISSKDQIRSTLEPQKQQKIFDEVRESLTKAKITVLKKYGKVSHEVDETTGKKSEIPTIVPLKQEKTSTTTTTAPLAVPSS